MTVFWKAEALVIALAQRRKISLTGAAQHIDGIVGRIPTDVASPPGK